MLSAASQADTRYATPVTPLATPLRHCLYLQVISRRLLRPIYQYRHTPASPAAAFAAADDCRRRRHDATRCRRRRRLFRCRAFTLDIAAAESW